MPPSLSLNPIFRRTLRYEVNDEATNDTTYDITRGDLYNLIVGPSWVDDDFTGAFSLFNAVRIRQIWIWGLHASSATDGLATVEISWQGKNGPDNLLSDTGNAFRPPKLCSKPPFDSLAFQWTNPTSTMAEGLLAILVSIGDVIDVEIEFTLLDGPQEESAVPNGTWSDDTVSGLYYSSLNNSDNAYLEIQSLSPSGI
jgi:hypothetical protein